MQNQTNKESALKKAQFLCAKQEKCRADIRQKLYEWKVDAKDHSWIIEKLEKEKFIDEYRFAGFYVRDKFKFNKWGKIKIEFELKARQIPAEIIKESLDAIDEDQYRETCEILMTQKLNSLKGEDPYKIREKLVRFAQSKGFEADLVFSLSEKIIKLH